MKRAIIFDFDGTIADSLPAMIQVFEELTKRPEHFTAEQMEKYRHLSFVELMTELKISKWKVPLLIIRGRKMLHSHMSEIQLHPGIVEVLLTLSTRKEQLYILSSNSTDNVSKYLEAKDLKKYFISIYGGASILGKAPRLNKLISTEDIDVSKSWYIGDETRDIIAAHSVGLRCASVTWGYNSKKSLSLKQPDLLADTNQELLKGLEA